MFKGKKYVTKGVSESIPVFLQNILWYMIETMAVTEKDYLQIFELAPIEFDGSIKQRIIHSQEVPAYRNEHRMTVNTAISGKIYIIEDGNHCTMLLSDEY